MNMPDFSLELEGPATITGSLFRVAGYPGYSREGDQIVKGELYRVPKNFDWTALDSFEQAFPLVRKQYEYCRELLPVYFEGKTVEAFIYEYVGKNRGSAIVSGEF